MKSVADIVTVCACGRVVPEAHALALERENAALREDAERYRWLRDSCDDWFQFQGWIESPAEGACLDAAIDEQRKQPHQTVTCSNCEGRKWVNVPLASGKGIANIACPKCSTHQTGDLDCPMAMFCRDPECPVHGKVTSEGK